MAVEFDWGYTTFKNRERREKWHLNPVKMNRPKPYWKIPTYRFEGEEAGISNLLLTLVKRSAPWQQHGGPFHLLRIYQRSAEGLFSYRACKVDELRRFVKDRSLKLTKYERADKATFIQVLERADAKPTFTRLLDLPPELRLCIFDHYSRRSRLSKTKSQGRVAARATVCRVTTSSHRLLSSAVSSARRPVACGRSCA